MKPFSEATAIIERHTTSVPVNPVAIAHDLGVKVYKVPNWPNDLSGAVLKNQESDGGFDIYVNANHPEVRRRFTIAHEVAHIVLHPSLIGDGIADDALLRSGLSNAVEAQANRLAADILMPRKLLDQKIADGCTDVNELAKIFNVSAQAMAIRLGVPQGE